MADTTNPLHARAADAARFGAALHCLATDPDRIALHSNAVAADALQALEADPWLATLCQWTRQAATVAASVVRGGTSTQDTHERVAALLANLLALPADMRAWLLGLPYTPEPIINPDECDPHGMPRPQ